MNAETRDGTVSLREADGGLRQRLGRVGSWVDGLPSKRAIALLLACSTVVWALQSVAWPVVAGRDLGTYLRYYAQMWDWHAVFPQAMVGRTPGAPLVLGLMLELGPTAIEVLMAVLFVASVLSWTLVAASWGRRASALVAATLLLYPGYGALFHQFSSDALSAAAFAFWSLAAVRISLRPTTLRFALLGLGAVALVLIRPGNQVLLVVGLVALLLGGVWRGRIARTIAFYAVAVAFLALWAGNNAVRYDDFTVARGANIGVPFLRAFSVDRIVSPENGAASRRLADAVQRRLLPEEPYRSYRIGVNDFFSSGSDRMMEDVASFTDRTFGWESDYAILREAGLEAVRKHPRAYARGVAGTLWQLLRSPAYVTPPQPSGDGGAGGTSTPSDTITVAGRTLPKPSEGDLIPSSHQGLWVSTPDNRIREVWTSPTDHHLVFRDPEDAVHAEQIDSRMGRLSSRLPQASGNATLAHRLNQAAYRFPPPASWLLVGLVAVCARRPRNVSIPLVLSVAGFLLLFVTALGYPAQGEYSMPVVPAFALLAGVGLLGPSGARKSG